MESRLLGTEGRVDIAHGSSHRPVTSPSSPSVQTFPNRAIRRLIARALAAHDCRSRAAKTASASEPQPSPAGESAVDARLSRSLHSRRRVPGDEPRAANFFSLPAADALQLINFSSRGPLTSPPPGNVRFAPPAAPLAADAASAPGHPSRTKDLHHVAPRPRRGIQPLLAPSPSPSQPRSPSPPAPQRTASHSCPAPHRRVARIPLHALRHGHAREQHLDV